MPSYRALHGRIARLAGAGRVLRAGFKGVEKESLRATPAGALAATPHSPALGSALTHPWLTTDYSEALLEFVTPPFRDRADVAKHLGALHRFVVRNIGDEILWAASMPCEIPGDEAIPIARYGVSNSGRLRHLYRVGLAHRYGRMMQVIAGVHFNYSLAPGFWPLLVESGAAHGEHRAWHGTGRALADSHYFGLIRNLFRHGWLLLYLFGASPAVSRSFLPAGAPELEPMGEDTWYARFGTSLRMSDIGYTNRIPGGIGIRYDDLYSYAASLYRAITTAHPPWEALGVRRGGEYRQLNANLLQMENEYYSSVRPKQPTRRGERPTEALQRRGVRYVELRSIDLDPSSPIGIDEDRMAFLEVFMLFCLLYDSPPLGERSGRRSTRTRDGSRWAGATRPRPSFGTGTRYRSEVGRTRSSTSSRPWRTSSGPRRTIPRPPSRARECRSRAPRRPRPPACWRSWRPAAAPISSTSGRCRSAMPRPCGANPCRMPNGSGSRRRRRARSHARRPSKRATR